MKTRLFWFVIGWTAGMKLMHYGFARMPDRAYEQFLRLTSVRREYATQSEPTNLAKVLTDLHTAARSKRRNDAEFWKTIQDLGKRET